MHNHTADKNKASIQRFPLPRTSRRVRTVNVFGHVNMFPFPNTEMKEYLFRSRDLERDRCLSLSLDRRLSRDRDLDRDLDRFLLCFLSSSTSLKKYFITITTRELKLIVHKIKRMAVTQYSPKINKTKNLI